MLCSQGRTHAELRFVCSKVVSSIVDQRAAGAIRIYPRKPVLFCTHGAVEGAGFDQTTAFVLPDNDALGIYVGAFVLCVALMS